jgi:hypothetical protein
VEPATASVTPAVKPDDRVLPTTRFVATFIVPFLVVGFVLLYLLPDHTRALFAWTIQPRMSAMVLGGAYLAGAYFFVRAATAARWHTVALGFLPVSVFAILMAVATILHWERFNHHHPAFWVWAAIYCSTALLVPLTWLLNRPTDPGTPDATDVLVPAGARWVLGVVGVGILLLDLLCFLRPQLLIGVWPWQLTPLTARVMAALIALIGTGALVMARDGRWSALRIPMQSEMLALTLVAIAAAFSWRDFHTTWPLTWVLGLGLLLMLIASPLVYSWMETRRRTG